METKSLNCSSCGAPIAIPDDIDYLNCSSCGTYLSVQRGEGYVALKMVEKVTETIQQVGESTETAIRDGTNVTQAELQRLQLTQEISMVEMQLSNLRSEIRGVQRISSSKESTRQLYNLHLQEYQILERLRKSHFQRDSLSSVNSEKDRNIIQSQNSFCEAQIEALNLCDPRNNEVKSLLTSVYRNTLLSTNPPHKPEDFTDEIAIKNYLALVREDIHRLKKVKRKQEVKPIIADLRKQERALTSRLGLLHRQQVVSQTGTASSSQLSYGQDSIDPSSRNLILKGCGIGIIPLLIMLCIGFVLFGTVFSNKSEQIVNVGLGLFLLFAFIGLLIGSWLFFRSILPNGSLFAYIFSDEREKRTLVAILLGVAVWIGITLLAFSISMILDSYAVSSSIFGTGLCLGPPLGIVAALMVLQPNLGLWNPFRKLFINKNQNKVESVDEPIPPP